MALICNGYRFGHMPHTIRTGALATIYVGRGFRDLVINGRIRNITAGEGITSEKIGVPMGYLHPGSWMIPQKAGNLSSHNNARGLAVATLTLVQGMAITGAVAGASTATATAKLVVSTSGAAAGAATVGGVLIALLALSGSAAGGCTAGGAKNAIAWCSGVADGVATTILTSYATGALAGHIYVNQSEATVTQIVNGIWNAEADDYDEAGTMGEAMGAAGSAGDPWITEIPGAYSGEQAGNIIGNKLLTLAQFLALK